ncbi:MAG TPA: amidophosphoribosyltransferase [Candidatus Saccharimonadales bacterium]|nr:amidophosphoribosyltransferase [Candidatus Saccharimonadales bacterium]
MIGETASQASETFEKPGEECGLFGIYAPGLPVAELTYNGLQALQHRGQEGAGIAVSIGESLHAPTTNLGRVEKAMLEGAAVQGFRGAEIAAGHVRYGTHAIDSRNKKDLIAALQPMPAHAGGVQFNLSHNGHIANFHEVVAGSGLEVNGNSNMTDSRLITKLMARELAGSENPNLVEAIAGASSYLEGAYSLVVMGDEKLIGVRDPNGFRPLVLGELPQGYVLASEIAALDIVQAGFVREIDPGEIIEIGKSGINSHYLLDEAPQTTCWFEHNYFSRPENQVAGENVAIVRDRLGEILAREHPVDADVILGAPESGIIAANSFARSSGIPFMPGGIVKNRYVGRTFITPGQPAREHSVRVKLNPNKPIIEGKSVAVVDDSIVRGTTTRTMVKMLREAGAKEVHLRISSAPYKWSCFYGMDTGRRSELIAANMSVPELEEYIGADSLGYLSPDGIKQALGPAAGKVCMACMTGEYPTRVPTRQLSLAD